MNGLIGKKVGMTSIYDDSGKMVAVTVIHVEPNVVTQVKTDDSDNYEALQLSMGKAKVKNVTKPLQGHFKNANTEPLKKTVEFRKSNLDKKLGDKVKIEDVFEIGDKVSAIGVTKGKGFQGVIRRHGFGGSGDATHGQHNRLRAPGSVGASSFPSKVVKGMRMAGRMGGTRVKIKNLKVVKILPERDLLLLSGAVPGHKGSFIIIEK
ncbi:MAG: 50S ribosomal protein L3 [Deltaproteobacteria bacterium]